MRALRRHEAVLQARIWWLPGRAIQTDVCAGKAIFERVLSSYAQARRCWLASLPEVLAKTEKW